MVLHANVYATNTQSHIAEHMIAARVQGLNLRKFQFAHGGARSIRSSLVLLVAVCVLPGSLTSAFLIFDNYKA